MADLVVEVCNIENVIPHPNADRLYLGIVKGWQTVIAKNEDGSPQFQEGEKVVFIPPNTIIPDELTEQLGVKQYLRSRVDINNNTRLTVRSLRLRGEASFGLLIKPKDETWEIGRDVAEDYGFMKYEPPVRTSLTKTGFNCASELAEFPRFESAVNFRDYKNLFEDFILNNKMDVIVTEKIHGTNSRIGIVNGVLVAGSNKFRRKDPTELTAEELEASKQKDPDETNAAYSHSLYWYPHSLVGISNLLQTLGKEHRSVVLYGEIFGAGIQKFQYGRTGLDYRVFDIMIDNKYLDFKDAIELCIKYDIQYVPILHVGEYSLDKIKELTKGNTTLTDKSNKLTNIREGVVVKPVKESSHPKIGRLTLNYVSDDYLTNDKIQDNDSTDQ